MASIRGALKGLRKAANPIGLGAIGATAGLGALSALQNSKRIQSSIQKQEIDSELETAKAQSKSFQIADLLEQARMQKAIADNTQRLAQSAPDLYSSVMAGQRLPKGSVVLGGRPREDLMRQLAASMDSGRFRKQDPLSDLMG